jgi:hypothetical protein
VRDDRLRGERIAVPTAAPSRRSTIYADRTFRAEIWGRHPRREPGPHEARRARPVLGHAVGKEY